MTKANAIDWKEKGFPTYRDYRKEYRKKWNAEKRQNKSATNEGGSS